MNTKTKIKDISDGTSKSIALSERVWEYPASYMTSSVQVLAANWAGCGGKSGATRGDQGWVEPTSFAPARLINDPGSSRTHAALSSLHLGGGVNAVAFDNSTRFISDNIDHFIDPGGNKDPNDAVDSVLEYLIAIKDGNSVSFP